MDYSQLSPTILPKVLAAVKLINNPEVSPEVRQLNQEILFKEVGQAIYAKIYEMNAWDMEVPHTTGPGMDNRYYGLAKVAAASVSNGNVGLDEYVGDYINTVMAQAQQHAMKNATQSGKHPTVTREIVGETCKWCDNLAGTYTNPGPEVFKRHGSCDCSIKTEGYKSRNGQLNNYTQSNKDKSVLSQGGNRPDNTMQTAIETALNAGDTAKAQQLVNTIQNQDLKAGMQSTLDALAGKKSNLIVDPITHKIIRQ